MVVAIITKPRRSALKLPNLEKEANLPAELAAIGLAGHRGMTPSKGGTMARRIARRKTNKQNLVALVFAVSFASLWPGE